MISAPTNISVIAELERLEIEFETSGENKLKCKCPFHDDSSPSLGFDIDSGRFKCFASSCNETGDIVKFIAGHFAALGSAVSLASVAADLAVRYGDPSEVSINVELLERRHQKLVDGGSLKGELYKRGVDDDLIRKYRLGEDRGRVMIPVQNEHGVYVNVRKYLPGAPGAQKMRNMSGHAKLRLYPFEQTTYDKIVICGGEMKAIVAAKLLNPIGYGAVAATGGEGSWSRDFDRFFAGKETVVICMDVDEAGQSATKKLCRELSRVVSDVRIATLPLDINEYPTGDINDYVMLDGANLPSIIEQAAAYSIPKNDEDTDDEVYDIAYSHLSNPRYINKRVRVTGTVTTRDQEDYIIPRKLRVSCGRDRDYCYRCPISFLDYDQDSDTQTTVPIRTDNPSHIELIGSKKRGSLPILKDLVGIPPQCRSCTVHLDDPIQAHVTSIGPSLDITNLTEDRTEFYVACIGCKVELHATYEFEGRIIANPNTHAAMLIVDNVIPVQDALAATAIDDLEVLKVFQPEEWTQPAIETKLEDVYDELSTRVTGINQRRDLHLVIDLAYHSVLVFDFNGAQPGWVQSLVIGDSAQGKTACTKALREHYRLGDIVECKNATRAGLVGGVKRGLNGRWFITWGTLPLNDRRLVVMEEVKGMSVETIGEMTSIRSSGHAELSMIAHDQTHARTRLIFVSNARSDAPLASYQYGVHAVRELFGAPEDVRRLDIAYGMRSQDVSEDVANQASKQVTHETEATYTSELCHNLVLFAWTRSVEQVRFTEEALDAIHELSIQLIEQYDDGQIPLIDRGTTHLKLARLSIALAARTFSVDDDDMELLVVRECHIRTIYSVLRRVYDSAALSYNMHSKEVKAYSINTIPDDVQTMISSVPHAGSLARMFQMTHLIDTIDIRNHGGLTRDEADGLIAALIRFRCLVREGKRYEYRKSTNFTTALAGWLNNGTFADRPGAENFNRF